MDRYAGTVVCGLSCAGFLDISENTLSLHLGYECPIRLSVHKLRSLCPASLEAHADNLVTDPGGTKIYAMYVYSSKMSIKADSPAFFQCNVVRFFPLPQKIY